MGKNVIIDNAQYNKREDTIILRSNNNKSEVIEPRPAIINNNVTKYNKLQSNKIYNTIMIQNIKIF
ncbi:MAG: hypothetical protein IJ848_02510 [Alphaproteobacteria bacterium]|nr:hypothetical protein [Alphaproteobacteria bacterium]